MNLLKAATEYVALKQSMGSRFHTESVILRAFCRAMGNVNVTEVGPEQVLAYIEGNGPVTLFWHRKCGALRGFYRFAMGRGYATCSPLPKTLPKPAEVFTPYIYSCDELRRLLSATEQCVSTRTKLEAQTLHMLLLLLYGAGLRISEALLLRPQDVDLNARLLTIRER